ncbi:MAG: efflux RND transporter periplasmic adaptor subunit [Thermoguttaceae bacterium]|nr:efflux RND transporter periplasmic adaptor subunit [Thermoguttaceae bacterium]
MRRKHIFSFLLSFAVLGTVLLFSVPLEARERLVGTARAALGEGSSPRSYPAVLSAVKSATLSFTVGGPLIEVKTSAGDPVKKGDILMRIDPRDFQHDVDAAQARLAAALAELKLMQSGARTEDIEILKARLDSARAQQVYALAEFQRAKPLLEKKAITSSELDLMQSNLRTADAQIRSLEQELAKAEAGEREEEIRVKEAEIAGLKVALEIARSALRDTCLRAPFDGIVAVQSVNNFEIVRPGTPVVTVIDISRLNVAIWIPESDILMSKHREIKGTVTFPGLSGKEFEARLKEAEAEANPQTRAWKVVFEMENPSNIVLLPGMTAMLTIRILDGVKYETPKVLTIPVSAVCADPKGQFVWGVSSQSSAVKKRILTGRLLNSQMIEVLDGLEAGEKIVISGASLLEEGDTLKEM